MKFIPLLPLRQQNFSLVRYMLRFYHKWPTTIEQCNLSGYGIIKALQFGRIDRCTYTLDYKYPFNAVQAMAIALASLTQRLK